jgi:hypothetical protein
MKKKKMIENDDTIKLMLAYLCISKEAEASLLSKVEILDRFKLTSAEIAIVCGVSNQSVMNARVLLKKTRHGKAKRK